MTNQQSIEQITENQTTGTSPDHRQQNTNNTPKQTLTTTKHIPSQSLKNKGCV